jgi:hypothetical protein
MSHKDLSIKRAFIERYDNLPLTSENDPRSILTYVWIDQRLLLRTKTRVVDFVPNEPNELPWWDTVDAMATSYTDTDIHLVPVRLFKDPFYKSSQNSFLVLCESLNFDKSLTSMRTCFELFSSNTE